MTCIAYQNGTMAADKQATVANMARTVTKIFKNNGWLYGFSGDGARCMEMMEWLTSGHDPERLPKFQRDPETCVIVLAVNPEGVIHIFEASHQPNIVEEDYHAIGSGRDYAMAAMYLGHGPVVGVAVASHFDCTCGRGVDVLRLDSLEALMADLPKAEPEDAAA